MMKEEKNVFGTLPHTDDWSVLRTPVTIGTKTAPNRIAYQAMEGCDGTAAGSPDELTIRRYERFASGGPGIVWVEATAVKKEGRANPRQLYLDESTFDDFKRLCDMIRETSMKKNGYAPFVAIQLTHSGRYSKPEGVPAPLIAYNNPIFEKDNPISADRIVSDDYLDSLRDALVSGAQMAERAGFDAADIKCCHRYLLCELLSAYEREGKYGGSYENRTRLVREAVKGAAESCSSDFVITSRMNAYDGFEYPYGFGVNPGCGIEPDFTEACRLANDLADNGLKLLNVTMGNPYFNPHVNRPYKRGGYQPPEEPIAGVERMLKGTREITASLNGRIPVICSGISYLGAAAPDVVAACIEQGWFSFAGFGRQSFAYPNVAADICAGKKLDPKQVCMTCSMCTELMRAGGTTGCVVRDQEVYKPLYQQYVLKK